MTSPASSQYPGSSFPQRAGGESLDAYVGRLAAEDHVTMGQIVTGWFGPCMPTVEEELADLVAAWVQAVRVVVDFPKLVTEWPAMLSHPQACRVLIMEELAALGPEQLVRRAGDLVAAYPMIASHVDAVRDLCLAMASADVSPMAGSELGKYRLERRLGSGSFGDVWQAFDTELQRYVALKLLRDGDSKPDASVLRRVMAEARAAAAIDHPCVVRIHAAGRFEDGRPYIDTQLVGDPAPTGLDPHAVVAGVALDRRGSQPMGVREAAALMEGIARGIAAAHARGVVHRDIKPANIIVTASGRAQLADFGLSAMIERGDPLRPRRSRHRITGTPAFMAPEQARGEPATPASDVYAMGATLAFLLLGGLPGGWSTDSGISAADELMDRLRRGETTKLASDPRGARVPAALCSVVDRAMAGELSARYTSATQLADDLRAWLDHRPTLAASPGAGIRLALWCRRHAAPVVVGSIALVTIVALSWRSYEQVVRARDAAVQAQADATAQRDAALEAQRTTNAINTFMLGTLINAQADEGGRTITLLEAVNQAEHGIVPLLGSKPLVEAGVRHVIGRSLATLGEFARAKAHLERALELRRTVLKPEDRSILEVEFALAEMLHFSDQNAMAMEQVAALQQRALAALGADDPLLRSITELDCAVRMHVKPDPSIRTTLELLLVWHQSAATVDEHRVASVLSLLGKFAKQTGDRQKAIEYFTQWRAIQEKLTGADSYASMSAASDLGSVHAELGNVAEAEPLQRASSAWFAEHLGDTHVHTLNSTYNLAWMLLTKKKSAAESLAIVTPLVAHARTAVGDRNALTLRVRLLEARALAATDPGERVMGLLTQIADDAAALGPEALSTEAVACRTYVETCTKLGLTDKAQAWKERAADTLKRARAQQ